MAQTHAPIMWTDGALIPWESASVHPMAHTLHYGSGCFEGIRAYGTPSGSAIFRLEDHIRRLFDSAAAYRINIPFDVPQIMQACIDVVMENALEEAYIRPVVYYGYESLGLDPRVCPVHVSVACFRWGTVLGEEGVKNGVRTTIASWRKIHHTTLPTTAKANGQYLNSQLAEFESRDGGFDEAIILNMEGNVAEGPGQNIFIVKDGHVITNDVSASILLGITRDTVIQFARDIDQPADITDISLDDLFSADEAFFTGTATEVTPIREVDGKTIGTGKPGPVTRQLQDMYFKVISGQDARYDHWLTYTSEPVLQA